MALRGFEPRRAPRPTTDVNGGDLPWAFGELVRLVELNSPV